MLGDGVEPDAVGICTLCSKRVGFLIANKINLVPPISEVFGALPRFFARVPRVGSGGIDGVTGDPFDVDSTVVSLIYGAIQEVPPLLSGRVHFTPLGDTVRLYLFDNA